MNNQPHTHRLYVRDLGWFWGIDYGDQREVPDKPWHLPWESPDAYARKAEKHLLRHIERVVRKHDCASRAAFVMMDYEGLLRSGDGQWGSEMLKARLKDGIARSR